MVHGHPSDPANSYTQGSTGLEQSLVDSKALVCMHQARRPGLDEGASTHINPWPDSSTGHINLDIYFEVSALLEGEQKFTLPSMDSEQAVTSKILSFSSLPLVLLPPDTLEHDLKTGSGSGKGVDPGQHDVAGCPACLKPSDHTAIDSEEAGRARRASTPAMFDCPQPIFAAVGKGDIKAPPNPCTAEAKCKAEWPLREQATEHKCGPH
jgi:hypothetical protein